MDNPQKVIDNENDTSLDHEKISEDSPQPLNTDANVHQTPAENEPQNNNTVEEHEPETDSITASMIEITKSQILASDQEQASSDEFITSNSQELIDSIYAKKDQEEEEEEGEETDTEIDQEKGS